MKTNFIKGIALLLFCMLPLAQADIRIATIDMSKVLQESVAAKSKLKSIDRKAQEAKKSITARRKALEKKQKELAKNGEQDSKEAIELRRTARELQRFVSDTEEELKAELLGVRQEVTKKAFKTVQQFASKKGIDLVLEKNDARTGPVLFANDAADITEDVLKIMN